MKIKTSILINFFKKIYLNGNVKEFAADFNNDVVVVCVNDLQNTSMIKAELKKENFSDYEALGKIAFMNLDKIISVLSSFNGEEIVIKIEGNLLIFSSGNRKVETELANIETITVPKFRSERFTDMTPIKINAGFFNSLVGDCNINKDYFFKFRTEEGKLIIKNTGDFRFTEVINVPELKDIISVNFGTPLVDSMKALSGDVIINIKDNYPAFIVEENEQGKVQILVAPRMQQD